MAELKDKIAVVTGAGRGIDRGIALGLSGEGAKVVIADLDQASAKETVEEIKKKNGEGFAVKTDVTKAAEVEELFKKTTERYGRIDILVNNAGMNRPAPLWEITEENWDSTIDVNLKSVFLCCKAVAPYMMKQKKGKIVNISSVSGKKGGTWLAPYCASKFGVIGFTQSIARELAPFNINANCVCPGIVFTPLWDNLAKVFSKKLGIPDPEKVKEYYVSRIPLKRPATVEDIAKVVVFMASEKSDYMLGQAINVTGGEEMR